MGVEKQAQTFRLDAHHLDLIRQVGRCCEPPVENLSYALRVLLNGFAAHMTAGRMPRWMEELQGVLRVQRVQDSFDCLTPQTPTTRLAGSEHSRIDGEPTQQVVQPALTSQRGGCSEKRGPRAPGSGTWGVKDSPTPEMARAQQECRAGVAGERPGRSWDGIPKRPPRRIYGRLYRRHYRVHVNGQQLTARHVFIEEVAEQAARSAAR